MNVILNASSFQQSRFMVRDGPADVGEQIVALYIGQHRFTVFGGKDDMEQDSVMC